MRDLFIFGLGLVAGAAAVGVLFVAHLDHCDDERIKRRRREVAREALELLREYEQRVQESSQAWN